MTTTVKLLIVVAVLLGEALMLAIVGPRLLRQDRPAVLMVLAFSSLATVVVVAVVLLVLV